MAAGGPNRDGDDGMPTTITPDELKQIPDPGVRTKVEYLVQSFEMIRSPLLPPEILARYGEVVPGLPEKFVKWTEDESAHRRAMEKAAFDEVQTLRPRAQFFGFVTAIGGLVLASLTVAFTNSAAGATVASVTAIVCVGGPFAARVLATRFGKSEGGGPER